MIKKIRVTNFKSFKDLEVELGKFTVLIGANASGKSNFVSIFRFLKDIANSGLDNAISMQGGLEYLINMSIGTTDNFSIKVVSDCDFGFGGIEERRKRLIGIRACELNYEFALKFKKKRLKYEIVKDTLNVKCKYIKLERKEKGRIEEKEELGEGEITLSRSNGKVNIDIQGNFNVDKKSIKEIVYPSFLREKKLPPNELIIQSPSILTYEITETFSDIAFYDFDPKLPKRATPITGKAELEEDASNLAIILRNILESRKQKRKLFNLVKDLLPFINGLDVEKFADKSLLFKLKEVYSKDQYIPASLISDGTINITALIIALFFEKNQFIIIEEPERNIHPYLIARVVNMMKDASRKKQIITTTHNPEIVKYADLNDLLLVFRDEEGFSKVLRPAEKKEIQTFLKNEIGMEELYVRNLLGA